jgi:hypothetical protein
VGAVHADVLLLADVRSSIGRFVEVFIDVYILLIVAYIIFSYLRIGYGSPLARVQQFLRDTSSRRSAPSTCPRWSRSWCSS